jgi:hypothetical protein
MRALRASPQIALRTHHFRWPITIVDLASENTWEAQSLLIRSSHHFPNSSLTAVITLAPLKRNGMRFNLHLSWHHLQLNHRQLQRRQLPQPKRRLHGADLATPSTRTSDGCTSITTHHCQRPLHQVQKPTRSHQLYSRHHSSHWRLCCFAMLLNFSEKHSIGNWISSTREGKELYAVHGNGSRSLLTDEQLNVM